LLGSFGFSHAPSKNLSGFADGCSLIVGEVKVHYSSQNRKLGDITTGAATVGLSISAKLLKTAFHLLGLGALFSRKNPIDLLFRAFHESFGCFLGGQKFLSGFLEEGKNLVLLGLGKLEALGHALKNSGCGIGATQQLSKGASGAMQKAGSLSRLGRGGG
jgi:hypothetical protein